MELITQFILILTSVVGTSLILTFLTSSRFRVRLLRGFLNDYSKLLHFSDMGKASGDVKWQKKIESILHESVPHIVSRVASENPVVQIALDYLLTETEIGELLSDPRTLPIIIGFAQKNLQGADIEGLLSGLTTQQKQDITDGFRIG